MANFSENYSKIGIYKKRSSKTPATKRPIYLGPEADMTFVNKDFKYITHDIQVSLRKIGETLKEESGENK